MRMESMNGVNWSGADAMSRLGSSQRTRRSSRSPSNSDIRGSVLHSVGYSIPAPSPTGSAAISQSSNPSGPPSPIDIQGGPISSSSSNAQLVILNQRLERGYQIGGTCLCDLTQPRGVFGRFRNRTELGREE